MTSKGSSSMGKWEPGSDFEPLLPLQAGGPTHSSVTASSPVKWNNVLASCRGENLREDTHSINSLK